MMNSIITDQIEKIASLCKQHHVRSLHAFGSVCKDSFKDVSDIDLLVAFKPMSFGDYADNYFSFVNHLEQLFERPVDLVTEKSLSNPYFIESINQTKALIYGQPDKEISV